MRGQACQAQSQRACKVFSETAYLGLFAPFFSQIKQYLKGFRSFWPSFGYNKINLEILQCQNNMRNLQNKGMCSPRPPIMVFFWGGRNIPYLGREDAQKENILPPPCNFTIPDPLAHTACQNTVAIPKRLSIHLQKLEGQNWVIRDFEWKDLGEVLEGQVWTLNSWIAKRKSAAA